MDGETKLTWDINGKHGEEIVTKWRSPALMPEWAARKFVIVTDVKAQRLQEITEEDAIKAGVPGIATHKPYPRQYRDSFEVLWDIKHPKHNWSSNPWCWHYKVEAK